MTDMADARPAVSAPVTSAPLTSAPVTSAPGTSAAELRTAAGAALQLRRVPATEGPPGADIRGLLPAAGLITYDPGLRNTGSCISQITYIDGSAGILRYRGYPIEQLAENSSFLEVAYLLQHGELPSAAELAGLDDRLRAHAELPAGLSRLFDGFGHGAHPMAVLCSAVAALSTYYPGMLDPRSPEQVEQAAAVLLAQVPVIAASYHRRTLCQPLPQPDLSAGLAAGFLAMMFGRPGQPYQVDPVLQRALDQLFVLHADHEQNCSTATVRLVGSARADLFVSVAAGISALIGPLHGGANSAVMHMLEAIRADGGNVAAFVERVKAREQGIRLMGFGHAIYRRYDPRAALVKETAEQVLSATGTRDELLDIALELERRALSDDYFISRSLYPNVDFYTGLIYRAMGFPTDMFTVLFVIGRLPGWIAQWRELNTDPDTRISRPRQVYTGPPQRDYVPLRRRG